MFEKGQGNKHSLAFRIWAQISYYLFNVYIPIWYLKGGVTDFEMKLISKISIRASLIWVWKFRLVHRIPEKVCQNILKCSASKILIGLFAFFSWFFGNLVVRLRFLRPILGFPVSRGISLILALLQNPWFLL